MHQAEPDLEGRQPGLDARGTSCGLPSCDQEETLLATTYGLWLCLRFDDLCCGDFRRIENQPGVNVDPCSATFDVCAERFERRLSGFDVIKRKGLLATVLKRDLEVVQLRLGGFALTNAVLLDQACGAASERRAVATSPRSQKLLRADAG